MSAREREGMANVAAALRDCGMGVLRHEPESRIGRGLVEWARRFEVAVGVTHLRRV